MYVKSTGKIAVKMRPATKFFTFCQHRHFSISSANIALIIDCVCEDENVKWRDIAHEWDDFTVELIFLKLAKKRLLNSRWKNIRFSRLEWPHKTEENVIGEKLFYLNLVTLIYIDDLHSWRLSDLNSIRSRERKLRLFWGWLYESELSKVCKVYEIIKRTHNDKIHEYLTRTVRTYHIEQLLKYDTPSVSDR